MRKQSLSRTWLLSYLVILVIPMSMVIFNHLTFSTSLEEQMKESNRLVLSQLKENMDQQLRNMNHIAGLISFIPNFNSLVNSPDHVMGKRGYEYMQLCKSLANFSAINDFIDEIYILNQTKDHILTTQTYLASPVYFQSEMSVTGFTWEEWSILLLDKPNGLYFYNRILKGVDRVLAFYVTELPFNNYPKNKVVFRFSVDRLMDPVGKRMKGTLGDILLVNTEGQALGLEKNQRSVGVLKGLISPGSPLWVTSLLSEVTTVKYYALSSLEEILAPAVLTRNLSLLLVALLFLAGVGLSLLFTRMHLAPLSKLVRNIKKELREPVEAGNELQILDQALDKTLKNSQQLMKRIADQEPLLRNQLLGKLLLGEVDYATSLEDQLEEARIAFPSSTFVLLLFSAPASTESELASFIVEKAVVEVAQPWAHCYVLRVKNTSACLLSFRKTDLSSCLEALATMREQLERFLSTKPGLQAFFATSEVCETLPALTQAYQEASEALAYQFLGGGRVWMDYSEIAERSPSGDAYPYSLEEELTMIDSVKMGQVERCVSLIDELIPDTTHPGTMTLTTAQCLVFDLTATALKMGEVLQATRGVSLRDQGIDLDSLTKAPTIHAFKKLYLDVLQKIVATSKTGSTAQGLYLKNLILRFVEKNLHDPNLCNTLIAEHCQISEEHLSRFFKKQTGDNLIDFIHKARHEESLPLLRKTNLGVAEIAQNIGYSNAASFTRVFKKYKGMTPGEYREFIATKGA